MADVKTFLEKLERKFFTLLEAKTGWGKEEVKKVYLSAVTETALDEIYGETPADDVPQSPLPPF